MSGQSKCPNGLTARRIAEHVKCFIDGLAPHVGYRLYRVKIGINPLHRYARGFVLGSTLRDR